MSEEKVRIRKMSHEPRRDRLSLAAGLGVSSVAVAVAVLLVTFLHSGQVQQADVASRLASVEKELVYAVSEVTPGFVQFRVFNAEKAPLAVCPGVRYNGGESDALCIGGAAYWPQLAPRQCGDFSAKAWNGYGTHTGWSSSRLELESAILFFYR